jgi:hypothetical protein
MKEFAAAIAKLGRDLREVYRHFEKPVVMVSPAFREYLTKKFGGMPFEKLYGIEVVNLEDYDWCIAVAQGKKNVIPTPEELKKTN